MVLNYGNLTAMLRSDIGVEAGQALVAAADQVGFGEAIEDAFLSLQVSYCTNSSCSLDQRMIRQAFLRFEGMRSPQNEVLHGDFSAYVDGVAELAYRAHNVQNYRRSLLSYPDGEGKPFVKSDFVRSHIERVADLVERMGVQYLYHPCCFGELINAAYSEFRFLGRFFLMAMPVKHEPPPIAFKRLLMEASRMLLESRAEGNRRHRADLAPLSFAMNDASLKERYDDLLQMALETVIRTFGNDGIYEGYAASLQGARGEGAQDVASHAGPNRVVIDAPGQMNAVHPCTMPRSPTMFSLHASQGMFACSAPPSFFTGIATLFAAQPCTSFLR